MVYVFDFTVPKNTTKETQQLKRLKLCYGIIHQIDIVFPSGCCGLVHAHIDDALHQVWPTNPDGTFSGDGAPISGKVFHELAVEPFELQLWAWNEDDSYDHTITVRIWILKPWHLLPFSEQMWRYAEKAPREE